MIKGNGFFIPTEIGDFHPTLSGDYRPTLTGFTVRSVTCPKVLQQGPVIHPITLFFNLLIAPETIFSGYSSTITE